MKRLRKRKNRKTRKEKHNDLLNKSSSDLNYLSKYRNLYINESLLKFNENSEDEMLNELITNIIDFRKSIKDDVIKAQKFLPFSNISSNFMLFHYIEKNLIEISYLPDIKTRNSKILKLYKWYKDILEKRNSIKNITKKSYIEPNVIYDLKSIKNESTINNDNEYNNESSNNNQNQEELKDEVKSKILLYKKTSIPPNIIKKLKRIRNNNKEMNNWDFMTHLYSKKNCSNNLSTIEKNSSSIFSDNIKKEENESNKKTVLPSLAPDLKYSYSYHKPFQSLKSFDIENKIIQSKYKLLAEKRSLENINQTINGFGISRAKLKENINNKHEIKNIIKMYVNNQDEEGLNITSPLLKKYKITKKEILPKPIKIKSDINKKRNYSTSNILEKEKIKINKNIIKKISILPINLNQLEKKDSIKKEKVFLNSYLQNKIAGKKNEIKPKINKNHLNHKGLRLFYGINHIKIFMDKIQNIDKDTNKIIDHKKLKKISINLKVSEKIRNNDIKDNMDKNNVVMKIPTQLFSSEALFHQKMIYLQYLNKKKNEENNIDILNRDINKDDLYSDETDSYYYNRYNYNLSAFHLNNLEKIKNSRNKYNYFAKQKCKSVDFNEHKKNEIDNNFILYKNNFLFMRKNLASMKKREFEELKNKMRNIKFKYNNRYDNIDEDKDESEIKFMNENNEPEKKKKDVHLLKDNNNNTNNINERQKVESSLSKAIINPNDNFGFFLYYYPRFGSKLLIKK